FFDANKACSYAAFTSHYLKKWQKSKNLVQRHITTLSKLKNLVNEDINASSILVSRKRIRQLGKNQTPSSRTGVRMLLLKVNIR
ncbi:hypothetical protein, partial [Lacticaseibacillus paracasei]|uniref:hypothetical protein n=1 Tax=Lacticaseibacillus paracasei TaxID=1597 RepID=UPI001E5D8991